jgi:hypothetical protein
VASSANEELVWEEFRRVNAEKKSRERAFVLSSASAAFSEGGM